jgi:hypothetical protein
MAKVCSVSVDLDRDLSLKLGFPMRDSHTFVEHEPQLALAEPRSHW